MPAEDQIQLLGISPEEAKKATFRRGRGCELCRHTGYKGRVAIYEILPFSMPVKQLTANRASSTDIRRKGCELGMKTLRDAGRLRACTGVTTIEEVLRVTADADQE